MIGIDILAGHFQDFLGGNSGHQVWVEAVVIQAKLEALQVKQGVGYAVVRFQGKRQPADKVGLAVGQFLGAYGLLGKPAQFTENQLDGPLQVGRRSGWCWRRKPTRPVRGRHPQSGPSFQTGRGCYSRVRPP
jgi:hypothetical protein